MSVILGGIVIIGLGWIGSKIWPVSDADLARHERLRRERAEHIYKSEY